MLLRRTTVCDRRCVRLGLTKVRSILRNIRIERVVTVVGNIELRLSCVICVIVIAFIVVQEKVVFDDLATTDKFREDVGLLVRLLRFFISLLDQNLVQFTLEGESEHALLVGLLALLDLLQKQLCRLHMLLKLDNVLLFDSACVVEPLDRLHLRLHLFLHLLDLTLRELQLVLLHLQLLQALFEIFVICQLAVLPLFLTPHFHTFNFDVLLHDPACLLGR